MTCTVVGQWDLSTRLVLDANTPEDRQVMGLSTPQQLDAALSTEALRRNATGMTAVSGTGQLTGSLFPAPQAYTPGMIVTIVPATANTTGATLDLNGLGARPMVKRGSVPLDSADLLPGSPARLMYDGERFHVSGSIPLRCPSGYSAVSREYCIADSARDTTTFYNAAVRCADSGARLCTFNEWAYACLRNPGFFTTVLSGEWVDHAANHENTAKLLGVGDNGIGTAGSGCKYGSLSVPTGLFRYRCCTSR